jgi:glycosyltransferase involved in cell wall biosynthesis
MPCPHGKTWKDYFLEQMKDAIDLARVHFVGRVTYNDFLAALSISTAHVYLTYPFVLSWSLLESMAAECCIVASDTAPVREVVEHDRNGLLVDFFDHGSLADRLIEACSTPARFQRLREAARETIVQRFDRRTHSVPAWRSLISEVLGHSTAVPRRNLVRAVG